MFGEYNAMQAVVFERIQIVQLYNLFNLFIKYELLYVIK